MISLSFSILAWLTKRSISIVDSASISTSVNWVWCWLGRFFKMKIDCWLNKLIFSDNPFFVKWFFCLLKTLHWRFNIIVFPKISNFVINWIIWLVFFLLKIPLAIFLFHFSKMLLSGLNISVNSKISNWVVYWMFIKLFLCLWSGSSGLASSGCASWDRVRFDLDLSISFWFIIKFHWSKSSFSIFQIFDRVLNVVINSIIWNWVVNWIINLWSLSNGFCFAFIWGASRNRFLVFNLLCKTWVQWGRRVWWWLSIVLMRSKFRRCGRNIVIINDKTLFAFNWSAGWYRFIIILVKAICTTWGKLRSDCWDNISFGSWVSFARSFHRSAGWDRFITFLVKAISTTWSKLRSDCWNNISFSCWVSFARSFNRSASWDRFITFLGKTVNATWSKLWSNCWNNISFCSRICLLRSFNWSGSWDRFITLLIESIDLMRGKFCLSSWNIISFGSRIYLFRSFNRGLCWDRVRFIFLLNQRLFFFLILFLMMAMVLLFMFFGCTFLDLSISIISWLRICNICVPFTVFSELHIWLIVLM